MYTKYILRFDDITPGMAWEKFSPLKQQLEALGIKSVLGVVPDNKDSKLNVSPLNENFFDSVRAWKLYGDTIAQHGMHHVYDSSSSGILKINTKSEFAGHSLEEQIQRISKGKEVLMKELVWEPYFMAPAHSFDESTIEALKSLQFLAITDGYGLYPYRHNSIILIPQLTSFPINTGFGYATICVHVNSMNHEQIDKLLKFIRTNAYRFVDFREVVKLEVSSNFMHTFFRYISKEVLRIYRNSTKKRKLYFL